MSIFCFNVNTTLLHLDLLLAASVAGAMAIISPNIQVDWDKLVVSSSADTVHSSKQEAVTRVNRPKRV